MALSFTRPDPASPASVSSAQFPVSRRGYDQAEVGDYLRLVAAEMARIQERERSLERELRLLQQNKPVQGEIIDEDTATRLLGEEAARVLQTAREAAAQIRTRAEESSARLLREATDEAQRLREEAEIEAARRRQDASADSEAELQMAKQQGRDMVNEARAYRERVLSELARRRELARQQIEQLIHGRDRLLQAFERSRIAAVEVMAELTPLGEPSEYVNLQPTTGPVPLMVPATPRPTQPGTTAYLMGEAEVTDATRAIDLVLASDVIDEDEPVASVADDETVPMDVVETVETVDVVEVPEVEPSTIEPAAAEPEQDASAEPDVIEPEATVEPVVTDVTNVFALREVPADEPTAASIAADDTREPAEVVNLFADADADADDDTDADAVDEPTAGPADGSAPVKGETVGDLFARLRAARADDVVAKASEPAIDPVVTASEPEPEAPVRNVDEVPEPTAPSPDEVVVPIILAAARKLKRILADEQNEVLDTLRRKEPVRSLDALLPWEADHTSRYAASVEPDLVAAACAGADGGTDGGNPAIVRPALDAVTNEIVAPLRDRLIRCIDRAEGDNAELANQVRTLYREWKTHRIDEHVEDIVRLAYDRGALTLASR
ncbi:MAG: hypothetical protein JWM34_1926 [Ilumatobacteraceae bacterium]|nr:hypothetical protein [Ilumatobacteraceae bacterium]